MSAPDPEGFSLLSKITAAAVAIIAPVWGARTWIDHKLDKKADVTDLEEVKRDVEGRRGVEAKLFDTIDQHSRRDEELFREVITKMGDNHSEVMSALGNKANR